MTITNADVMRHLRARTYTESVALRANCPPPSAPDPTPAIDGYRIGVTCPRCNGPVHHLHATTASTVLNARSVAAMACPACRHVWHLEARLTDPTRAANRERMADELADRYAANDLVPTTPPRPPRKRTRNIPEPRRCGTLEGYRDHLWLGEETCDACRRVNADQKARNKRERRHRHRQEAAA